MPPLPIEPKKNGSKKQTQIKTSLPYCLYKMDTRFFKLGDEYNSKIRFTKIEQLNRRTQSSQILK